MPSKPHPPSTCACGNHAFAPMRHGVMHIFDVEDVALASRWRWGCDANNWATMRRDNIRGRKVYFHRVLMGEPPGLCVDHINGNQADNRRRNLRVCTRQQNSWNRRKRKDSGSIFKGVVREGKYIGCMICIDGVSTSYWGFQTERDAAIAYNEHALKAFGPFARLNAVYPNGRPATRSAINHPDLRSAS